MPRSSPRLVAERLGIKPEQVEHRHGDRAHEIAGYASVGSRTAMTAGHAMVKTLEAMLAKGKTIAATALEAGEGDIEYKNGALQRGRHRPPHVAVRRGGARQGDEEEAARSPRISTPRSITETPLTFPNGCHIAEVEIDPADRAVDARLLFGGRRQRQHPRPHDRRGPGARLGRPWASARRCWSRRGVRRRRPARQRLVHGLRHAARRRPADVQGRRATRCRRRPIRSASRAPARPAPPRRSPR